MATGTPDYYPLMILIVTVEVGWPRMIGGFSRVEWALFK